MSIIQHDRAEQRIASTVYDLVITGATWMAINAAIAAAMRGLRVAIVEATDHIGGHTLSGLNLIDVIATNQIGGYAWHQVQRMAKLEGVASTGAPTLKARSSGTSGNSNYWVSSYDKPKYTTVRQVLMADLAASGADVYLNCPFETVGGVMAGHVEKSGARITGIRTAYGIVRGLHYMDTDYHGDLMAGAGCAYTIGRESSSVLTPTIVPGLNAAASLGYGESLAGAQPPTGNTTTYLNNVDLTDGAGNPLYPLVPDPGLTPGQGDHRIQAYSYRAKLRLVSAGGIPFTKPAGYVASDFTLYGRIATAQGWTTLAQVVAITALNDGGYDLNAVGRISNDLLNGSFSYPESTPAQRLAIAERHRYHTQGLLYYLMTDSGVPSAIRTNAALYGWDNRYWEDTGYFPPQMYIREGRRMIGDFVLTQMDIQNRTAHADSICMMSYDLDCHAPNTYYYGPSTIVADGDFFVTVTPPVRYPLRAILPRRVDCENLTVISTPSVSHIAWFDARMEIQMAQAAEAAACLTAVAVRDSIGTLHDVPYASLLAEMNRQKALLS